MWNSIQNGPYKRLMIPNSDDTKKQILEPLSKMTTTNNSQYIADVKVMNYLLQVIQNDIYNLVDACKNAKDMWERISRLMFGFDVTSHVRHSRLMDEFDKFTAKEGESLESVYERLTTLLNIMDHNNVHTIQCQSTLSFSILYNLSGANMSPWFMTMKLEIQFHMMYSRAITQKFFTPIDNRLRTSSNTRNQAMIQDGRVYIQTKNACYGGNGNKNAGRQNMNQAFNAGIGNDERNQIDTMPVIVKNRDAKYFKEQMLLAMKGEARSNLNNEENDFMLTTSYGEETMKELTIAVILMARIQPLDGNAETVPSYDAKAVSEVNASSKVHEQVSHIKRKTTIQTSDDDQIDFNIIFDDPYVENNGGMPAHDSNAHDEYHEIQMLAYNVQKKLKIKND
nr:hypothetical protein [Tanacetum cinerariifolium]